MTRDGRVALAVILGGCALFFVTLTAWVSGLFDGALSGSGGAPWEKRIARVDVYGEIFDSEPVVEEIRRWRDDPATRALVVRIDSPGGGVAASQEIFEELLRFKESGKPVVASMGSLAASGGYYVALGCDEIIASPGTITGSIGVIMTLPNTKELLRKVGLEIQVIKAGEHKDVGSPFRPLEDADRAILQELLDDAHQQFVQAFAAARGLAPESALALADGRVFTGRRAQELGMVDGLGTYHDAVLRAGELAGIEGEPRVVQEREPRWWLRELLGERWVGGSVARALASGPRLEYRWAW